MATTSLVRDDKLWDDDKFRYGELSDHGKLWNEWDNMWDGKLRIDKLSDLYDDQNIRW